MRQRLRSNHWLRWVLIVIWLMIVYLSGLAIDIYRYSFINDPLPADAAIVLGAAAWDGHPSPVFEERIKHAIDLYRTGQVKAIIFTGGLGKGQQVADSVVAAAYAIQQGVDENSVFCEMKSRYTVVCKNPIQTI